MLLWCDIRSFIKRIKRNLLERNVIVRYISDKTLIYWIKSNYLRKQTLAKFKPTIVDTMIIYQRRSFRNVLALNWNYRPQSLSCKIAHILRRKFCRVLRSLSSTARRCPNLSETSKWVRSIIRATLRRIIWIGMCFLSFESKFHQSTTYSKAATLVITVPTIGRFFHSIKLIYDFPKKYTLYI